VEHAMLRVTLQDVEGMSECPLAPCCQHISKRQVSRRDSNRGADKTKEDRASTQHLPVIRGVPNQAVKDGVDVSQDPPCPGAEPGSLDVRTLVAKINATLLPRVPGGPPVRGESSGPMGGQDAQHGFDLSSPRVSQSRGLLEESGEELGSLRGWRLVTPLGTGVLLRLLKGPREEALEAVSLLTEGERAPQEGVPILEGVEPTRGDGQILGLRRCLEAPQAGKGCLAWHWRGVAPLCRGTRLDVGERHASRLMAAPSRLDKRDNKEDESGKAWIDIMRPDAGAKERTQKAQQVSKSVVAMLGGGKQTTRDQIPLHRSVPNARAPCPLIV